MNIFETIRELVAVVENGIGATEENEKAVIYLLDSIALNMHTTKPTGDFDWGQIPENDHSKIRKSAEARFPNWGYYNIPDDVTGRIASTEIIVGDAIDDIADIVSELKDFIWLYDNKGDKNALCHLHDTYVAHWRAHLRDLQYYLHNLSK